MRGLGERGGYRSHTGESRVSLLALAQALPKRLAVLPMASAASSLCISIRSTASGGSLHAGEESRTEEGRPWLVVHPAELRLATSTAETRRTRLVLRNLAITRGAGSG